MVLSAQDTCQGPRQLIDRNAAERRIGSREEEKCGMTQGLDRIDSDNYVLAPDVILTPGGPVRDHVIVVQGGKIAALDRRDDPAAIRLPDMAIIPGMVDSHAHAGQTFGKSLIGGEPTQIWRRIWIPLEDALTPERSYVSAKWIFLEALRGGYTTLVNFNRNSPENNEAVHQAAQDTGIRPGLRCGRLHRVALAGSGDRRYRAAHPPVQRLVVRHALALLRLLCGQPGRARLG